MDIRDTSSPVYIEQQDSIGRLVLNRPDKRNALTEVMLLAIPECVKALDADPDVRVIIVTSSTNTVFAAGVDIEELQEISGSDGRQEQNRLAIRNAQRVLARSEKPTIAQIYGPCVGGGCGIALHCDIRFAGTSARLGITPAKLGIVYPLNDTKQLVDLVGPSKAKLLLFTGRILNAEEALNMGLVDVVVPDNELEQEAHAFATEIAGRSQYSVRHMKQFIQRVLDGQVDDDEATAAVFRDSQNAEDAKEGMKAFMAKRSPNFKWNG